MLSRIVSISKNSPLGIRFIVNIPQKLQNPFYKPLPDLYSPKPLHKRQSRWDDPNYIYPTESVRPTLKTGKALISEIEEEERQKLSKHKKDIPNIRSGDVLRFGYYRSVASKKMLGLEGLVIQTSKRNSLQASCSVLMNYNLCEAEMKLKLYSPMLAYVKIGRYGSGILRKKLGYITKTEIKPSLTREPIYKHNNHRKRIPKDHNKK